MGSLEIDMRLFLAAAVLAAVAFSGPALAKGNPQMKVCATQWKATPHTTSQTYKQFMATCLHVGTPMAAPTPPPSAMPAPAKLTPPSTAGAAGAATAKCRDGSMSYSVHHSGSCSHHGGVAQFLR